VSSTTTTTSSSIDSQQEPIQSLYSTLLDKPAIRPLGEAPEVSTLVNPNLWTPDANKNLKPLKQISKQRVQLKQTEVGHEEGGWGYWIMLCCLFFLFLI
jgi:hypothetical protein